MLFHRSGQVAVQAALLLAMEPQPEPRRVRELVPKLGIPAAYLAKVLHELARAGVLKSVRGPGGGFQLARPAGEISLWHLLAAVEPLGQWGSCLLGLGVCDVEATCPLHNNWIPIRDQIVALLQTKTLADIAVEAKQRSCHRLSAGASQLNMSHLDVTPKRP